MKKGTRKINIEISSKPERVIAAASVSLALAILFDGGKRKKSKGKSENIVKRFAKNYRAANTLLDMTAARKASAQQKQRAAQSAYSTKLNDLEIEQAVPFEL